jgi:hypothetical protein
MIGLVLLAFIVGILLLKRLNSDSDNAVKSVSAPSVNPIPTNVPPASVTPAAPLSMAVNTAVMVTAELDFGPQIPTIAQALSEVERRYQPDDGQGRTFAVLDAYGEPTADHKLHISMHVSSEKVGDGSLVFRRTGEVLWKSKITPVPGASTTKNLTVSIGDDAGGSWVIDGRNGAGFILDAPLRDKPATVRDFWPDGAEREVTLIYSACGCPVKVMVRRVGERTMRTRELPVIFPDDPPVVQTIAQLMRW